MPTNRSMPPGPLVPTLAYGDVREASAWLCKVFGFTERLRIGGHRIQLNVGAGSLVVTELPAGVHEVPATHGILLPVTDVDALHARAVQRGARSINAPTDQPYGERQCTLVDIGGHRWTLSQTIADADPADRGGELVGRGGPQRAMRTSIKGGVRSVRYTTQ